MLICMNTGVRTKKRLHEQAVTDDICIEIDRNYTVAGILSIALSILCNLMHAVPRSECIGQAGCIR